MQDITIPQIESMPWISSLTYCCKANGTFKVCLDPKDLNKAIFGKQHKDSTLEEITHKLAGSTTYSKLDAKMVFGVYFIHMTAASSLYLMCTW